VAARTAGPVIDPWERVLFTAKREWEELADALVSLTRRGAKILRARWPGKRVVHIPHGCPSWFPQRKEARGMVIGAFGFLAPTKDSGSRLPCCARCPEPSC
jgi:hypothetical protein